MLKNLEYHGSRPRINIVFVAGTKIDLFFIVSDMKLCKYLFGQRMYPMIRKIPNVIQNGSRGCMTSMGTCLVSLIMIIQISLSN